MPDVRYNEEALQVLEEIYLGTYAWAMQEWSRNQLHYNLYINLKTDRKYFIDD